MKTERSTPLPEPAPTALSPTRRSAIREAALLMGADEAGAELLAAADTVMVDDAALCVHPTSTEADGTWIATAAVARPEAVAEAVWCDALLIANAQLQLAGEWAFGLDAGGEGRLFAQLASDELDPVLLGTQLRGMLDICRDAVDGALARASRAAAAGVPA